MSRAPLLAALLLAGVQLAACSNDSPSLGPAPGSYRGAKDQAPWDSTPPSWGTSKWTPGDRASWEAALRGRAQGQNEYAREN